MDAKPDAAVKTKVCWTVVRRSVGAELLDLLGVLGEVVATRGRALAWNRSAPSSTSYDMAVYRLRRSGLLARRRQGGHTPVLMLTPEGDSLVSIVARPERWWQQDWDGVWHALMYDVPERHRGYRRSLRCFLQRRRMGCLQKSVWISCRDVRPAFADLQKAAAVGDFAVLLEARTLLGQTGPELAARAWDFDRLAARQREYIQACARRLAGRPPSGSRDAVLEAMRVEQHAYRAAMASDPLLPHCLWPSGYEGPAVVHAFRARLAQLSRRL